MKPLQATLTGVADPERLDGQYVSADYFHGDGAIGTYSVLSGHVTERTREIGVRLALGASRRNLVALVLRQRMTLAGLGMIIGVVGAGIASDALVILLFGVSRLDSATYFGVITLLAGASAVACAIPAWQATRIHPAVALTSE
jgi:putative ABC transport system permease protein